MKRITVTRRGDDDYIAQLEGQPEKFGVGKSLKEAVGDLIMTHMLTGCEIEIIIPQGNIG